MNKIKLAESWEVTYMKEWICVQVNHHNRIAETIEEYQRNGWSFYTYQAVGSPNMVNHYLLFKRGE
jgi:hypothetical protein